MTDNRALYPKTMALVQWALDHAQSVHADSTEYEGTTYESETRSFTGDLGKRMAGVRDELGKPGKHTLVCTEHHILVINVGGNGMASQFGRLMVAQTIFTPVASQELLDWVHGMSAEQCKTAAEMAKAALSRPERQLNIMFCGMPGPIEGSESFVCTLMTGGGEAARWGVITKKGKHHALTDKQATELQVKIEAAETNASVFDSVAHIIQSSTPAPGISL